jgi:hypothetical protein
MAGSIDDITPEEWQKVWETQRRKDMGLNDPLCGTVTITDYDPVNSPSHYNTGSIECIEAMEATLTPEEFKGYLRGAAFKYVWRCNYKGKTKQDIDKAIWYLNKLKDALDD